MGDWFAPKRYGYGAGRPISWQGWAATIAFLVLAIGAAVLFATRLFILLSLLVPLTIAFVIVTARTTKGGWRWRWGQEE